MPDTPEREPAHDAFGHSDVADNLLTMIKGAKTERLMIGLLGGFGVGKSTVIELLKRKLEGDHKYTVIRLSAERHEIGGFHRSFVFAFAEKLVEAGAIKKEIAEELLLGLEYSTSRAVSDFSSSPAVRAASRLAGEGARRTLRRIFLWSIAVAAVALLAWLFLLIVGGDPWRVFTSWFGGALAYLAILGPIVQSLWSFAKPEKALASLFKPGTLTHSRPRVEAADEFERAFGRLSELVNGRLVIAVDDIDRLSPSEVLAGLNSIRSFQLTCNESKRPIFIVSADERVIATAIMNSEPGLSAMPDSSHKSVSAYLNRLFVQRQHVPPHGYSDIQGFARSLLLRSNHVGAARLGKDLDDVLTVLIHDKVSDPRHVVRLLNAFFGDFRLVLRREERHGVRSITAGEVSSHPKTLARMVVLKVDFPRFYEQLQGDLDLLVAVENTLSGTPNDVDLDRLKRSDWDVDTDEFRLLSAYVGRTAGWVEPSVDMLPFVYLGQDELDRDLGSKDARTARSLLANAQIAELRGVLKDAGEASDQRQTALVRLMIESLGRVPQHELSNAISTAVAVSDEIDASLLPGLADAVAAALPRASSAALDQSRLTTLASHATQPHLASSLVTKILEPMSGDLSAARDRIVLARRDELSFVVGASRIAAHLHQALTSQGVTANTEELAPWLESLQDDRHKDLGGVAATAIVSVLARSEDEPNVGWLKAALVQVQRVPSKESASVLEQLLPLMSASLSGHLGAFLVNAAAALQVHDAKAMAGLPRAIRKGLMAGDSESKELVDDVLDETIETSAELLRKAVQAASTYTYGKISIVRDAAILLAALLEPAAEQTISSAIVAAVDQILADKPSEATPIVQSLCHVLDTAAEVQMMDEDRQLVISALRSLDDLTPAAATSLQDVLASRIQPSNDPKTRHDTLSFLTVAFTTEIGAAWVEPLIAGQVQHLKYPAVEASQISTDTLVTIFAITSVSTDSAQTVITAYQTMTSYGHAPSGQLVAKALCRIPWPTECQSGALAVLASQQHLIDEESYCLLIDQLAGELPSEIPPALVSGLTQALRSQVQSTNAMRRESVARLLRLIAPVDAAVIAIHTDQGGILLSEILEDHRESDDLMTKVVTNIAAELNTIQEQTIGETDVLLSVHSSDPQQYETRIIALIGQQLARDATQTSRTWSALLSPVPDDAMHAIAQLLAQNWDGGVADASATLSIIGAISRLEEFDHAIEPFVGKVMERWINTECDTEMARNLAVEFSKGPRSRRSVMSEFGPNGPWKSKPSRKPYDAVREVIKDSEKGS